MQMRLSVNEAKKHLMTTGLSFQPQTAVVLVVYIPQGISASDSRC